MLRKDQTFSYTFTDTYLEQDVTFYGLPQWLSSEEYAYNAGDAGSIPGSGRSPGREDPLQEGMATQPSILAWRIPLIEKPGGLQPMAS